MGARAGRFELRSIAPDATPEEVAAITAAIAAAMAAARSVTSGAGPGPEEPSTWVQAARISSRRSGYSRGDWRLSGRLGRRNRA